jgi:hypothetical protein
MKLFRSTTILSALICLAFLPNMQAGGYGGPPPDGCYPGFTTAEGCNALAGLGTGQGNTGIGWYALWLAGGSNFNTAVGAGTLVLNTGDSNTAVGAAAMLLNTIGAENTAVGTNAMANNDTGTFNTAVGAFALLSNTSGGGNTANGYDALSNNTTGSFDTANGANALLTNTTGSFNAANGFNALVANMTGNYNTANGYGALFISATGNGNTANGWEALFNTTGDNNIALGAGAGTNLTTGNNNIDIFDSGVAGESNTIRVGTQGTQSATYIAGIYGATTSDAGSTIPALIDMNGNLGTAASSERFKTGIKPMDKTSEALLALKPVTFHYKNDSKGVPQFGLVAEQVANVDPDLVVRDKNGEIYTVRYEAVNAMLLNEFLKEHHKVEALEATVANLVTTVKEQTAQLQKVTAQLEVSKPAPQIVLNNQ